MTDMHNAILVYYQSGYSEVIGTLVEVSMNEAVEQVKALPDYPSKGEVRK